MFSSLSRFQRNLIQCSHHVEVPLVIFSKWGCDAPINIFIGESLNELFLFAILLIQCNLVHCDFYSYKISKKSDNSFVLLFGSHLSSVKYTFTA